MFDQNRLLDVNKLLELLLVVLASLAVLLSYLYPFHQPPWKTFHNEAAFALFVLLAGGWVLLVRGRVGLPSPWPWLLLLGAVLLHYAGWQAGDPKQRDLLVQFLAFAMVGYVAFAVGLNARQAARQAQWLLTAVWLAAVLSALLAVMQWAGLLKPGEWDPGFVAMAEGGGRVASNMGQANNLGTLLVIGCWCAVQAWLTQAERSPARTVVFYGSLALLTLAVVLSGSRTAVLNLALAPLLWWLWSRLQRTNFAWVSLLPVLMVLFWFAAVPFLGEWLGTEPLLRTNITDPVRLRLWRMGLQAVGEHFWLGDGFAAAPAAQVRLTPEHGAFMGQVVTHIHNTVLDLWLEFGVPLGSVIAGAVLWQWCLAWWRSTHVTQVPLCLMASTILLHGMLEFPLNYGYFLWLLACVLGWCGADAWRTVRVSRPLLASCAWLGVSVSVLFVFWQAYLATESLYWRARNVGITAAEVVAVPNPWAPHLYAGLLQRLEVTRGKIPETMSKQELERLVSVIRREPFPDAMFRAAVGYAYHGDAESASWWMDRLCGIYPNRCQVAQASWENLGLTRPGWPDLPWENWRNRGANE